MSAGVRSLGLYDLLAPQFLLGFSFPDYIDKYLSLLSVADFQTTSDDIAVLYTGTVYFPGSTGTLPKHTDPSGAVFDFHDISFRFRLLIPRTAANLINKSLDDIPSQVFPPSLEPLKDNVFGPAGSPSGPSDYPGVAFQLELLVNLLTFHLGPHWEPAVQNSDFSISPNPGSPPSTDVRVLLPQILLRYSQVEDFTQDPSFEVAAWGNPGFDAPNDLAEGQLATMDPPLAIHSSGRVAFGVDTIILDLSSNGAPPEILQYFGTSDDFKGLYIKAIQVYYCDQDKDLALNFSVRNALISFAGEVWLEAELDLIFDEFTVAITAWDGSNQLTVNPGSQLNPSYWHGGSLTMPSTGVLYLQIAGGIPPYTESVVFNPGQASPPPTGGQQLWDNSQRLAQPPTPEGAQETGSLVITVKDSSQPVAQKYVNNLNFTVTEASASTGTPPAPPAPPSNPKPSCIRRLSIRLRLEQNTVVLAEISGEIDFAKQMQSAVPGGSPPTSSNSLGITNTPAATTVASPPSGIVDFTLNVTYDLDTGNLTETLTLGAVPADANGLVTMANPSDSILKDILGAILIFTPILTAATKALDPADAGQWTEIAVDLGVPAAIGALDVIRTTSITLYGGSLQLRENIPAGKLTNAALTFDYGVQFGIEIDALKIKSTKPLKVRYQAVGVSLLFGKNFNFQIVLDTSKGYSLDLSDPGLFNLPSPFGDLLKIAGAQIARFNPLTLEVDLEIKADLGIITVDKFSVKLPLDPLGAPTITPSGIAVNIPETITGSGSVNISNGGFEGSLDVTICSIGLRMVAYVGVNHISDGSRQATAFYFGFEVDFPAPITLGTTGLSLFGIFGLFGMNYDRVLSAPIPGDAVGPDLRWLMSTKGQPYALVASDGTQLWGPKIDNWALGLGVIVGSSDGFLLNMRGMLILELPGPRIIITVNLKIVADLPGISTSGMDTTELDVGIIGILDLDFVAQQITLGVMIDFEIKQLLSVQIPIQLYYSWIDPSSWHLWIGTIQTPASATILGIARGGGYLMMGGQAIQPFPPGSNTELPGVAVALGISASVIWGSQSSGLYLSVVASANFGVSFTPSLFILGDINIQGSLHLLVVNISATGDFQVKAPNPVYLHVHICGSVSFFFFSVSACVDFSIGTDSTPAAPPKLISNVYLQSYAPVIAQGQGDSPIDASLGNALPVGSSGNPIVVPINAIPVIQMLYGVGTGSISSTFTEPIPACPTFPGGHGVNFGGGRYVDYEISSLSISPALLAHFPPPPVAWRPNKPSSNTSQTLVDLALFSRNPNVTTSALERSTQLTSNLNATWGNTCAPIAPAASVFFTFCGEPFGPSQNGWLLNGTPWPDPPNTTRSSAVPTQMQVSQPTFTGLANLLLTLGLPLAGQGIVPAQVIGEDLSRIVPRPPCLRGVQLPQANAIGFQPTIAPVLYKIETAGIVHNATTTAGSPPGSGTGSVVEAVELAVLESRWLGFATGGSQRVRVLFAINTALFAGIVTGAQPEYFDIVELNAAGATVAVHTIPSLNATALTSANFGTTLPAEWLDATGPWYAEATSISDWLFSLTDMTVLFAEFVPSAAMASMEVVVASPLGIAANVVIGAIESLSTSEAGRAQNATSIQQSTIQAITTYLDGGSPVPLLEPDTVYTITVKYNANDYEPGSSSPATTSMSQAFEFKTSATPPTTLEPYVLCSAPAQGDEFVFYGDPLDIIFNDASVFTLIEAYGEQLTAELHAADGLTEGSPSSATLTTSPPPLHPIHGIGPATYDSMFGIAQQLSCLGGSISQYQNQKFTAPVTLRPLMGYTFDLVTSSTANTSGSPNQSITPLFRRTFSTGRYENMTALGAAFRGKNVVVTHRPLTTALSFPASGGAQVFTDAEIELAFLQAGEEALAAPSANSIVFYWLASQGGYVPHAILIDAIEPLWRSRSVPGFTTPIPTDPSFKIVTIQTETSVEVREAPGTSGNTSIGSFIVSPGGARTVAMFKAGFSPPAAGTPVTLQLHRPLSSTYGNPDQAALIVELVVQPQAPWENDHV
jgi:hypothetical protein